jgi:NAD(P)-dependent dehydrogenase (short-subunit alcohol dehydrogenase family)
MGTLDGLVALVNSGRDRLGMEMARALAGQGAAVVLSGLFGRRSEGPRQTTGGGAPDEGLALDGGIEVAAGDTATLEGAQAVVEKVLSRHGKVDILVNDPGAVRAGSFQALRPRQWERILQAVLKSAFCCVRAAAPQMQRQGRGRLVHVLPSEALFGCGKQSAANAAFMALVGLSRNAGIELERFGITSNCIAIHGAGRGRAERKGPPEEARAVELGYGGSEVGRTAGALAVFLASDRAAAISGQIFGVYGKEILLFSQSRIARSVHRADGWDLKSLEKALEPALAAHFTPLRGLAAGIGWGPLP